jgi:hypothetical protein
MGAELPVMPDGWPHTGAKRQRGPRGKWNGRRAKFEEMWRDTSITVEEMADFFETSRGAIYTRASSWDLGRRLSDGRGRKTGSRTSLLHGGSQRRFKSPRHVDGAGPHVTLEPHDPRLVAGITIFPKSVVPARKATTLLKSGVNSRKIGRMAEKGRWKGFPLYTLTLQERATCPRTCKVWATCYGNNMHMAERIVEDGTLTRRLWGELASLSARHPLGFIVRLHVLGDFYSRTYVDFWRTAIEEFPALRVFGFTARRPSDPIGFDLLRLVDAHGDRFVMRFSGGGYKTDCSEVVDRAEDAIGIVCPAQLNENRCCATCGLCWTSNVTISFLRH